jgi:hypothetical protein
LKSSVGGPEVSSTVIEIHVPDSVKHFSRATAVFEKLPGLNWTDSFQARNIVGRVSTKNLTSELKMAVPG